MKTTKIIPLLKLCMVLFFVLPSVDTFAKPKRIRNIRSYILTEPRSRYETVDIVADKDAGYANLQFNDELGELRVSIADSNGTIVDEMTINADFEKSVNLYLPDSDETYSIQIEGEKYYGFGEIM